MLETTRGKARRAPVEDLEVREGLAGLTPSRIATLYRRAPLLRPVGDPALVWKMFEESSLVLTAWNKDHLIGIARVLTDGVLFSYLCDLAVEPDVQGSGIGRALVAEVLKRCSGTTVLVSDTESASGYYEQLGFSRAHNVWRQRAK